MPLIRKLLNSQFIESSQPEPHTEPPSGHTAASGTPPPPPPPPPRHHATGHIAVSFTAAGSDSKFAATWNAIFSAKVARYGTIISTGVTFATIIASLIVKSDHQVLYEKLEVLTGRRSEETVERMMNVNNKLKEELKVEILENRKGLVSWISGKLWR